jgi:hypothetical protein
MGSAGGTQAVCRRWIEFIRKLVTVSIFPSPGCLALIVFSIKHDNRFDAGALYL